MGVYLSVGAACVYVISLSTTASAIPETRRVKSRNKHRESKCTGIKINSIARAPGPMPLLRETGFILYGDGVDSCKQDMRMLGEIRDSG